MSDDFDIAIISPVSDDEVEAVAREFEGLGATVVVETLEGRPQASIGLFATALVVLIGKKYFETLLQEAAKGHYPHIKTAILRLLKRRKSYEVVRLVSSATPNKVKGPDERVFAVTFVERPGAVVKFAFTGPANEASEASVDQLFRLLESYCRGDADPRVEVLRALVSTGSDAWRYFLVYDQIKHEWVPADLLTRIGPPTAKGD